MDTKRKAWQLGFVAEGSPSIRTLGPTGAQGLSAGVALVSRFPRGLHPYTLECAPATPSMSGRVAAAFWPAILSRGVLVVTVYLYVAEGISERNRAIIDYVVNLTRVANTPCIIGGDFNMSPETLAQSGVLDGSSLEIVVPDEHTYCSAGTSSKIDYFIVHRSLAAQVTSCAIDPSAPVTKHCPVTLSLPVETKAVITRQLRAPAPHPKAPLISCQPKPCKHQELRTSLEEVADAECQPPQETMDRLYGSWAAAAETHLDSLIGLDRNGKGSRADVHEAVWRPAVKQGALHQTGDSLSFCLRRVDAYAAVIATHARSAPHLAKKAWINALVVTPPVYARYAWKDVRDTIRSWRTACSEQLAQDRSWLQGWALKLEDQAARRRSQFWARWKKEVASSGNGSAVFRIIRGSQATPTLTSPGRKTSETIAAPLNEVIEKRADQWHELWQIDQEYCSPFPEHLPLSAFGDIARPTGYLLRKTITTYSWTTSVGTDWWVPRSLAFLSDALLDIMALLIWAMVRHACSPAHLYFLLIHLIPKPCGGDRPIGVFPTIVRVASRWFRRTYGCRWQEAQPSWTHWGIKDHSVEECVWRASAIMEWSRAAGRSSAAFFLDVAKAFENVDHDRLAARGLEAGFCTGLLRWVVHLYRMPRAVVFLGSLARTVRATRTVVPGDSMADLMMRLVVAPVAALLRRLDASCMPAIVVDDVQCLIHGPNPQTVGKRLATLMGAAIDYMEHDARLPINKSKVMTITSSAAVRIEAASRYRLTTKAHFSAVRNLGMDCTAGWSHGRSVKKKRHQTMHSRASRLRRIAPGKRGRRFIKSGISSVALYGTGVVGVTASDIRSLRSSARRCLRKKTAGRSLTWDLRDVGDDPGWTAVRLVIMAFFRAWHNRLVHPSLLRQTIAKFNASPKVAGANGPVSAFIKTVSLIGWSVLSDGTISTAQGATFSVDDVWPWEAEVRGHMSYRFSTWAHAARNHSLFRHLTHPPFLESMKRIFGKMEDRYRALVEGFMAGLYEGVSRCCCGEEFSDELRLWYHLWWDCPSLEMCRRQEVDGTILSRARRAFSPWIATGLFPHPFNDFPPPDGEGTIKWCQRDAGTSCRASALFGREAFSDGSTIRPQCQWTARSGWSVVQIGSSGQLLTSAYGTLPHAIQDNNAAEIWAVFMWLRHLDPTVTSATLYSDSLNAVNGFADLKWACRHDLPYADI